MVGKRRDDITPSDKLELSFLRGRRRGSVRSRDSRDGVAQRDQPVREWDSTAANAAEGGKEWKGWRDEPEISTINRGRGGRRPRIGGTRPHKHSPYQRGKLTSNLITLHSFPLFSVHLWYSRWLELGKS